MVIGILPGAATSAPTPIPIPVVSVWALLIIGAMFAMFRAMKKLKRRR
jgi:hypothetical protein